MALSRTLSMQRATAEVSSSSASVSAASASSSSSSPPAPLPHPPLHSPASPSPPPPPSLDEDEMETEWEEWDGSGSFAAHCVAGSFAGITEHTCMFPLDSMKTHIQSNLCTDCAPASKCGSVKPNPSTTWAGAYNNITANGANKRGLFRGMSTMFIACVPAHALYFSVYETGKSVFDADGKGMSAVEAMATGAATAVFHDSVMVPFETIKQRRQLGHYDGVYDAASRIFRGEGLAGFYRSFAVTLSMNVPYSMVVVGTNEYLRGFLRNTWLSPDGKVNLQVSMTAGATAGAVAAAATCPLDVIKTRQQTHALLNAVGTGAPMVEQTVGAAAVPLADSSVLGGLEGGMQVARSILATDGLVGFYRGWWLRATIAAPATAISWTAYDGAKKMLDAYL